MSKGQTVECMTVRHYEEKDTPKMEVWVGSGLSDNLSGQVTIIDLSDNAVEVGRIPKEIFTFRKAVIQINYWFIHRPSISL